MARQATVREWEQRVLHGLLNAKDDTTAAPTDVLSSSIIVREDDTINEHSKNEERGGLLVSFYHDDSMLYFYSHSHFFIKDWQDLLFNSALLPHASLFSD
jgi:hypothetical protein